MVQHADDSPEFQLRVLREAVAPLVESEALEPRFYAMLWDRAHRNKGQPQRYGTQFRFDSAGTAVPQQLEDPARVDARRAELGLGPLGGYLEAMTRSVRGAGPEEVAP